ncbi:tetratricopeptide repeat protein [Actinomadura chibensis]|uniref:Tetratricopeptide repeat protein n=1 Tax=Actinomadura chibensis TaxID=392828 RepID=A0A5D0NU80_9ACTN|nr:hypothetical protein [Actinomadura chibensis]TYB48240.1 hypothetical protein FXF69_03210 [Actinomadura chibensis]
MPDPEEVHTTGDLARALNRLRGTRSYAELDKAARALPRAPGEPQARLPASTLGDLFDPGKLCRPGTLLTYLAVCGVPRDRREAWERARDRAGAGAGGGPPGAVRVRDAHWRMLGVHEPIQVPGADPGTLPAYVERDLDCEPVSGIRDRMAAAAARGGFVVVVGGSSTGKTRCLLEAVRALLGDWWLLRPRDPGHLAELAAEPPPRLVVWLDELQDHMGDGGLTAGTADKLISGGCVLVGTLWPSYHDLYRASPASAFGVGGDADRYRAERQVIRLAQVLHLPARPTAAEDQRARALADPAAAGGGDTRLRAALRDQEYGFTQTIAAAPQLVECWNNADPYAGAILTAAVDAVRLGVRSPLPAGLLRDAAPGYCTPAQQARAPANWFEQSLDYATQRLHGATAALSPVSDGMTMGTTSGYRLADYLLQHALPQRRPHSPPATFWTAGLTHLSDPGDHSRLGRGAADRLRYRHAIPLLGHGADNGDTYAAMRLARLLVRQGKAEELRTRADNGDLYAATRLADLLTGQGQIEQALSVLRPFADNGDVDAATRLADLLARQRRVEELRARADNGDPYAATRLINLLAEQGGAEQTLSVLRTRADNGDSHAAARLVNLLVEQGQIDELRTLADNGGLHATMRLADLLAEHGQVDELRSRADKGDQYAATELADLLAREGQTEQALGILRTLADELNMFAAMKLANLLAEQGQTDELRSRADDGDHLAALRLARLLAEEDRTEELRTRAENGDPYATMRLGGLLAERGRTEQALGILRTLADNGGPFAEHLADSLKAHNPDEASRLARFGLTASGEIETGPSD